jgi:hypothetical protein
MFESCRWRQQANVADSCGVDCRDVARLEEELRGSVGGRDAANIQLLRQRCASSPGTSTHDISCNWVVGPTGAVVKASKMFARSLKEKYANVLLSDPAASASNDIDRRLWKFCFYMHIEELRQRARLLAAKRGEEKRSAVAGVRRHYAY